MVFVDRKAKYPGRWTMIKSDGTSEVVTLVRNDEPEVEGTPMNAKTLNTLSDVAGADVARQQAEAAQKAAYTSATAASGLASAAEKSKTEAATSEANAAKHEEAAKKASEEAGAKAGTDKTLTIENAPADAKATGDALADKADKSIVQDENGNAIFYSKAEVEAKIKELLAAQREEDLARIKFWASNDPTSPASFIGGTWEQIKDSFILAAGDTYAAGSTGGEAKHSLTNLENGPHSHEIVSYGNADWYYKTASALGTKLQAQHHVMINDISLIIDADESAGYLATNTSGAGQPHNNMPPYYCMYAWKRVA